MAKTKLMDNLRLGRSPLSNRILVYRMGKTSEEVALESKDFTADAVKAVVERIESLPNRKDEFIAKFNGEWKKFTLTLTITDAEDPTGG
jgi:hypothetical protein